MLLAALVAAAPAPAVVTVYETATTTYGDAAAATAAAATSTPVNSVAAASTTASAASSSSSGGFLSGFISQFKQLLSAFDGDSASGSSAASSASASAASPAASATTSESNLDQFLHWLTGSASTLASSTTASATGAAASATYTPSTLTTSTTAPQQSASSSSKTSASTTSKSSETSSSSDSDIYAGIYNSPDVDEDFAKSILDAHNKYRADHGVGELSWDVDAYNYAKNNADNYDCSGVLTHTHGKYGENLAAGFSTGTSALHAWYVEGETYDYTSANTYDHFTQVVWKGSTKVGCAYKDCSSNNWGKYVICEYDPAGNIIGYNSENVLPLVSGASASADY